MKPPANIEDLIECPDAYANPRCPYVKQINHHSEGIIKIGVDVDWLKKGYWVQVVFSAGTLCGVVGVVLWLATGHVLPI